MKAFPNHRSEGMDLRDYFAAQALQAMIQRNTGDMQRWPANAYDWADRMMKAREELDEWINNALKEKHE
jgi:hypothetical protein